ncbi:protein FAM187B [Alligator sinensis]|uniref:Protein FAM187B n=1 Tax=Alligator sinensis TaxID=38654 RepID=A0A1U7SWB2_ALLSI|nr:protein FAM187B [Alligator sinensis]
MTPRALALATLLALTPAQALLCPRGRPCTVPAISLNPVTLPCPGGPGTVTWLRTSPLRLLRLSGGTCLLPGGALRLAAPWPRDSGVYTCRRGDVTVAYYDLAVQDVEQLHVSHVGRGQVPLGPRGPLFTAWTPWQACDRCGVPGERKQVGFCYTTQPRGLPRPCGLAGASHPPRGPELRVKGCWVPCKGRWGGGEPRQAPQLLLTHYPLHPAGETQLRCPAASIYSPVAWQAGTTALNRLQAGAGAPRLDKASGGAVLVLPPGATPGTYHCYVGGRLAALFWLGPALAPTPARGAARAYGAIEAAVVGLALFLVALLVLGLLEACRRRPGALGT